MRSPRLPLRRSLLCVVALLLRGIIAANYELGERKLETYRCPDIAFHCDDGSCVNKDELCNGIEQCADGSDEKPEICKRAVKRRSTSGGCILPPQPENGQYKLSGCESPACYPVPGTHVQHVYINYTCNPGSPISGRRIVVCDDGWTSSFPTCSQDMCTPLVNPSRDIECTLNGRKVDCDKPMLPGTRARVECTLYYTHDPEFSIYVTECQASGKWSRDMTSCIASCGEPVPDGLPFMVDQGKNSRMEVLPWHAGIYIYTSAETSRFMCGGTIVSEEVIVSAASCFWYESPTGPTVIEPQRYKVAVGKHFRYWNNTSRYTQTVNIKEIVVHDGFRGAKKNYVNDIALIILRKPLIITVAVRPICVDYGKQYQHLLSLPGKLGVVVGWGKGDKSVQSDRIITFTVSYVDSDVCEDRLRSYIPFLTADKLCLGQKNGTTICPGDNGEGIASQARNGRWYLVGILSIGPLASPAGVCVIHDYEIATRVSDHYDFLFKFKDFHGDVPSIAPPAERPPQSPTGCVLPSQPDNGEFAVQGCDSPCEQRPGSIVKHQTNLIFKCSAGFDLKGNEVVSCNKQDWSSSFPTCSRVSGLCPPLKNPTREISCVFQGQDVDCSYNASRPGTRASVTCKPYYENVPGLETYDLICNFSGKWNGDLQSCSPKCGEANPRGSPFVGSGYTPQIAEFPWHVGFYKIADKPYPTPSCGGSIVAPRIVISAAHCFWREGNISFKEYKVVAGKYFHDWNKVTELVQHLEIEDVKVPKRYRGADLNYASDIAVVILKRKILINDAVRPLCLDFGKTYKRVLFGKTAGKVAGWGYMANDTQHDILQAAVLKYVDIDECGKHMPPEYNYFLTHDKFCAGNLNKTTVCNGDSGGGYCVQQNGRWYLFGVVSNGPVASCGVYPYAAFTDIYEHLDFVREHYYLV